jgi:hypothetical protein
MPTDERLNILKRLDKALEEEKRRISEYKM